MFSPATNVLFIMIHECVHKDLTVKKENTTSLFSATYEMLLDTNDTPKW